MKKITTIAIMMLCLFIMTGCSNSNNDTNSKNDDGQKIVYKTNETAKEDELNDLPEEFYNNFYFYNMGYITIEISVKDDYIQSVKYENKITLNDKFTENAYKANFENRKSNTSYSIKDNVLTEVTSFEMEDFTDKDSIDTLLSLFDNIITEDSFEYDNGHYNMSLKNFEKFISALEENRGGIKFEKTS